MSKENPPDELSVELARLWTALQHWASANVPADVRDKLHEAWLTVTEVVDSMKEQEPRDSD